MDKFRANNHSVPKLYLKAWAQGNSILTYRLLVPTADYPVWNMQSLKGISVYRHLYTSNVSGAESDEVERWLDREFENPATEVIDRASRELSLTPAQWHILVRFLAAQDVRTPARLREFLKRQNATLPEQLDRNVEQSVKNLELAVKEKRVLESLPVGQLPDFPVRVFVERSDDGSGTVRVETLVGRHFWLGSIKHTLTSTVTHLLKHRWTILNAPRGMTWPTSDSPVVRLNFSALNNYNFQGGWGRHGGEIFMPLTPRHLLYTHIGHSVPRRGTVPPVWMAELLRRMLVEHADRLVFAAEAEDFSLIRPRVVSKEAFHQEQEAWRSWHKEQADAEVDFFAADRR